MYYNRDFDDIDNSDDTQIYHYCSMDSFVSILESGVVRLNEIDSMNDPSENSFSFANIYTKACEMEEKNKSKVRDLHPYIQLQSYNNFSFRDEIERAKYNMKVEEEYQKMVYVMSFSSKINDLNQWRLYGGNGTGIALGFDKKQLSHYAKTRHIKFSKIVYDNLKKRIESAVQQAYASLSCAFISLEYLLDKYPNEFTVVKDNAYKDEAEYRLWCEKDTNIDFNEISYHVRNDKIIKHIEIPLNELPLVSITLGPINSNKLDNIRLLLDKTINKEQNKCHVKIHKSMLPYRQI